MRLPRILGLPVDIQEQAKQAFALFEANAYHPTLRLKAQP